MARALAAFDGKCPGCRCGPTSASASTPTMGIAARWPRTPTGGSTSTTTRRCRAWSNARMPRAGRRRRRRASRHDGRHGRRDPRGPRRRGAEPMPILVATRPSTRRRSTALPRRGRLDAGRSATAARYQMDPANGDEALREVAARPGRGRRHRHGQAGAGVPRHRPPGARSASACRWRRTTCRGEYAMVKAAADSGLDRRRPRDRWRSLTVRSSRAGADMILTYFAKDAARLLA